MSKSLVHSLAAAAVLLAFTVPASASLVVDTGTPDGKLVGAYGFESADFYAGHLTFNDAAQIRSIQTHVLGGTAGETFTVALYADSASHLPGIELFQASATFGADGWNGVSGLSGWNVSTGDFWVAFEVRAGDDLGSGSITGALLDRGVPAPLLRTAFNVGSDYRLSARPLDFGLRVDATAPVPEPAVNVLMLAGVACMALVGRRRRN